MSKNWQKKIFGKNGIGPGFNPEMLVDYNKFLKAEGLEAIDERTAFATFTGVALGFDTVDAEYSGRTKNSYILACVVDGKTMEAPGADYLVVKAVQIAHTGAGNPIEFTTARAFASKAAKFIASLEQ